MPSSIERIFEGGIVQLGTTLLMPSTRIARAMCVHRHMMQDSGEVVNKLLHTMSTDVRGVLVSSRCDVPCMQRARTLL